MEWAHFPVYILNKAIAWSAVAFLLYAGYNNFKRNYTKVQEWGRASTHTAFIHILFSITILSGGYYSKFFISDQLSFFGELVITFGVLSAYFYYLLGKKKHNPILARNLELFTIVTVGMHLLFMGLPGWYTFSEWHGGLPPISLLSFIMIFATLFLYTMRLMNNREQRVKVLGKTTAAERKNNTAD